MFSNTIKSVNQCFVRNFNWKYPYPKHLQVKSPSKEALNQENIVQLENPLSENDKFNKEYINRNPRNLEQMLLAVKPNGYPIDAPNIVYWNKLLFEKTLKHTTAKVIHNSGQTVVLASTKEWAIRKQLKSTIDASAVVNIARILAQRCLQAGILFVHKEFSTQELNTQKIKLLLKTLEEGGLKTEEPRAIRLKDQRSL